MLEILLSVVFDYCYAECLYAQSCYAEHLGQLALVAKFRHRLKISSIFKHSSLYSFIRPKKFYILGPWCLCLKLAIDCLTLLSVVHVRTLFFFVTDTPYKLPYFLEYSAHFFTLKMMLKYSLCTIHGMYLRKGLRWLLWWINLQ